MKEVLFDNLIRYDACLPSYPVPQRHARDIKQRLGLDQCDQSPAILA